jgi:diacylglycerol kinase (ATP)
VRRRALLIVNRNSRNGASDIEAVCVRLRDAGFELLQPAPSGEQDVAALILRHRHEIGLVIIGGGDGSMNAAAPALVETGLPLGLLPLGTANDLARTLGIAPDPLQACDTICAGVRHRIDLGLVNGRHFFNVAHVGLGEQVARELSGSSKQRLGVLAYPLGLARALRAMRAFRAQLVCDGRRRQLRTIQLAVGNGRHFGGGMTVAAPARIDDGCFFLCSVAPPGWRDVLGALGRIPDLRAGRFAACDPVFVEQARCIEVHTARPMPVSADGELVAHTPARFELAAAALEVFVPFTYFGEENRDVAQG